MMNRYLRQQGIVDQNALSKLRVLVSGSSNGIADVLVLLDQLGVSSNNGKIGIYSEEQANPETVFWNLAFSDTSTFQELSLNQPEKYLIMEDVESSKDWDIHLLSSSCPLNDLL